MYGPLSFFAILAALNDRYGSDPNGSIMARDRPESAHLANVIALVNSDEGLVT